MATARPVRRNRLIRDVVHRHIVDGLLPDGLVLTESALARLFDVSRAPAAEALARLSDEGVVTKLDGRGFVVGTGETEPVRADLADAGLRVPPADQVRVTMRGWRETLYPRVEIEIAGCSSYGTFGIAGAAMAKHFGVSRTTSQDMLSRLERVGLLEQGANGRWTAPRLTPGRARDHYGIRRLLEPAALVESASRIDRAAIDGALDRIRTLRRRTSALDIADVEAVENDLHRTLLLGCPNALMLAAIHRSQLPLIATHMAFERNRQVKEMHRLLDEHGAVLCALAAGERVEAGRLLRRHLDQGRRSTIECLERHPDPPAGLIPPYMVAL